MSMFDSELDIEIDSPIYGGTVALRIDREGAEYIAEIMEEEFHRTADSGAFVIAREIRSVFAKFDA